MNDCDDAMADESAIAVENDRNKPAANEIISRVLLQKPFQEASEVSNRTYSAGANIMNEYTAHKVPDVIYPVLPQVDMSKT